jgi:hypothetical protein
MSTKFPIKTINYETTVSEKDTVSGILNTYVNLVALGPYSSPNSIKINTFNLVNQNLVSVFRVRIGTTFGLEVRVNATTVDLYLNGFVILTTLATTAGIYNLYPGVSVVSDGTRIRNINFTDLVVDSSVSFIEWYNTSANTFTFSSTITLRTQ